MVPAETGESEVAFCDSGDYAANVEKAVSRVPERHRPNSGSTADPERFATPGVVTIEALSKPPYSVAADRPDQDPRLPRREQDSCSSSCVAITN